MYGQFCRIVCGALEQESAVGGLVRVCAFAGSCACNLDVRVRPRETQQPGGQSTSVAFLCARRSGTAESSATARSSFGQSALTVALPVIQRPGSGRLAGWQRRAAERATAAATAAHPSVPYVRVALLKCKRMVHGGSSYLMPLWRYSEARAGIFIGACRK